MYPCRYEDIVSQYKRPVPQLSMIVNETMDFLYHRDGHLLLSFDQPWLSSANLTSFCESVHRKGATLDNCWGFIGCAVRPVCRPGFN